MKQIKQLSIWIIALAGWMIATDAVQAKNYDFKHNGLYYKITQAIPPRQVKVVPENAYLPYYSAGNEPTGAVTVPKSFSRKEGIFTYTYTVTEIGERAFKGCDGITSITIPAGVKTIGRGTFQYCETLKSVTLPNSIQEIEERAFGDCSALQSIDIPAGVKTIEKLAFWGCSGLKTVTVHWNTPLAVPDDVFYGVNTANVTLKVPYNTKKKYQAAAVWKTFRIDDGTSDNYDFEHNGLFYIITKNTNPSFAEVRVVPENADDLPHYSSANEPTGAVTIPSSFSRNTRIYKVMEIGKKAFERCKGITSVTIPDGITRIGKNAFFLCEKLSSVSIPASVTTIESGAFSGCSGLKTVTVHWNTPPPAMPNSVFTFVNTADVTLKVPYNTKKKYQAAAVWKTFRIDDGTSPTVAVTGVTVAPNTLTIAPGKTQALTATVQPAAATDKKVTWKSSDAAIATVDASGTVRGVKEGSATITVKTHDGGHTATCAVTVKASVVPVSSVTLSLHKVTVNGDITRKQLTATVKPANATNKSLTWKSNNPTVASVDADGLVTIHKKGKATVTATANDGSGRSDACLFDVISTVANETVDGLRVYAAGSALYLTLPSAETVHLYHVSGAMVKTLFLNAGDHVLPLPSGVYLVRVGERVTKILIK